MTQEDDSVRKHVLSLLRGSSAHISFDDFISGFPADLCNRHIDGLPYTPWQVLEHMRLALWDILESVATGTMSRRSFRRVIGHNRTKREQPHYGKRPLTRFATTSNRCSHSSTIQPRICTPRSRTAMVKQFCAKRSSLPITMLTI